METSFERFGPLLVEQLREQTGTLMAAVQLITPVIQERQEAKYEQYLAMMNQSLYRLLRLTNNVEFAALPSELAALGTGPLDLAELCRELCSQVIPLAGLAGVAFQLDGAEGELPTTGDAALLRRMLLNLIANAIRAAGRGGQAGLRLCAGRGRVRLTVRDNGPGLPAPGDVPDVLTVRPDGIGLGLEVARRVASLHGGVLVFDHQADRGGRAEVSLPLRPPAAGATLRTPVGYDITGGFSPVLVELSSVLPSEAFRARSLES